MTDCSSVFDNVSGIPLDPIFGVVAAYAACPRQEKKNVAIGIYRGDDGLPFMFPSVAKAEQRILGKSDKEYVSLLGFQPFLNEARSLLWTDDLLSEIGDRIVSVQTPGGGGGGSIVSRLCKKHFGDPVVFLSTPSWVGYNYLFVEHPIDEYPYFKDGELDVGAMVEGLRNAPEGSLVLLQASGHNPTGVDPNHHEWRKILNVCQAKNHLVFFDVAYMGMCSNDLDDDVKQIREYAKSGQEFFVAFTFSKCMGLYGRRVACLHVVTNDPATVPIIEQECVNIARGIWGGCPAYGGYVVNAVLSDPQLKAQWKEELLGTGRRLIDIRNKFVDLLENKTNRKWDHVRNTKGMFAFTGLTQEEVKRLADEWAVFMTANGRISFTSLNSSNVEYVANAVAAVLGE